MRAAALVLALALPAPVTSVGAVPNSDGSVTVFWTLPVDPTVVGVTVIRERLDLLEPDVQFVLGLDTSLTDFSTVVTGDYRYGVYTRNGVGDLSTGAFAEVFWGSGAFVGTSSTVICWAAASPGPSAWPLGLAIAFVAMVLIRRPDGEAVPAAERLRLCSASSVCALCGQSEGRSRLFRKAPRFYP